MKIQSPSFNLIQIDAQVTTRCPNCGEPVFLSHRFCASCGRKLGKEETLAKAGITRRFLAEIIDRFIVFPFVVYFFPPWIIVIGGYSLLRDCFFSGRSVGKKVMGLRVVCRNRNFTPCNPIRSLLRNLIRTAAQIGYTMLLTAPFAFLYDLFSLILIVFHKRGRRIGDWLGKTQVITEEHYLKYKGKDKREEREGKDGRKSVASYLPTSDCEEETNVA